MTVKTLWTFALAGLTLSAPVGPAYSGSQPVTRPTIVLVHGAFAESASWNAVATRLQARGYTVVAAPNPLRGVASDAEVVAALARSTDGPVVLVGHSYGGAVITTAALSVPQATALVYVAAFAPDVGETSLGLSGKFPGSTLGGALAEPVLLPDGRADLFIRQDRFAAQFAADVDAAQARLMAATQRPIARQALEEPSGEPAWKRLPSWFVYGSADLNIPPAALGFMAERARSRRTVVVPGASHVVMISNPEAVAELIHEAATR